jgi:WD40 repeat protein
LPLAFASFEPHHSRDPDGPTLEGHESFVADASYLPGGDTVVTGSFDGTVRMWDVKTGASLSTLDAEVGQVLSLAISPDGRWLLAGGDGGAVALWQLDGLAARRAATLPGLKSFVMDLAIDATGSYGTGVAFDGEVLIWTLAAAGSGEIAAWPGSGPVAFSHDGRYLATGDAAAADVRIVDTATWEPVGELTGVAPHLANTESDSAPSRGAVVGLAFSPDGAMIASTSSGFEIELGDLTLWEGASGERVRTPLKHPFLKGPVAFSGDGKLVAVSACEDNGPLAYVWSVDSGELRFRAPSAWCGSAVDLSADGTLLAVQSLREDAPNVQVWDTTGGRLVMEAAQRPAWIGAARFSPTADRILTAGDDGTARIWEVATGKLLLSLEGHTGPVEAAEWTAAGDEIITGSHDGSVRVWDAVSGETRLVLCGHGTWPHIAVSPDGRYLASSADGMVRIWAMDLEELITIARARLTRSLTSAECVNYHFADCPHVP